MADVFHLSDSPHRELQVQSGRNGGLPVLKVRCFARKRNKFERYTELERFEVMALVDALQRWLGETR